MSESASLLFGDEQISFPGILPCAPPRPSARTEDEPPPERAVVSQCPGQLCLGPSQLLLADADPEPLQPSLLPEPAPWEIGERPSTRRLGRTAAARGASRPGTPARMRQLGLFSRHR